MLISQISIFFFWPGGLEGDQQVIVFCMEILKIINYWNKQLLWLEVFMLNGKLFILGKSTKMDEKKSF